MTHPITNTESNDVSTALALATDALATARQFAMSGAAEAAGALILGAFEGGVSTDIDIDLRVPIAYARGAAAWLVTEGVGVPWSPELHRRCDRLADALDTVCAAFRPATAQPIPPQSPRRQRKPSLAALKRRAEKAGLQMTSVTMPDGTIIHFGEGEQQQGNELDEWIAKHARAT